MASADATGLLDLEPFSSTEVGRKRWAALAARLASRPFLRSEGVNASLAVPTRAAPWLVEQSRELVRRFDHFYRLIVDAKGSLAGSSGGASVGATLGAGVAGVAGAAGTSGSLS